MALHVARGLFRLWLVLSVLWIGGVGLVTWWTFAVHDWIVISSPSQLALDEMARRPRGEVIFEIRAPDGHTYRITGPEGATEEEAQAELIRQNPQLPRGALISALAASEKRRSAIWEASLLAVLPPAFMLALGSALVWAFKGFR